MNSFKNTTVIPNTEYKQFFYVSLYYKIVCRQRVKMSVCY